MSSDTADARLPHRRPRPHSTARARTRRSIRPKPKAHAPRTEPGLVARAGRRVGAARALAKGNPLGEDFDYTEEFAKLDVEALKRDVDRR